MSNAASPFRNWIPYKLMTLENEQLCRWLYIGDETFSEPFFDETICKCRSLSYNSTLFKSISNISVLHDWAATMDAAEPAAFIFHVSRCGSTIISQLLSTGKDHIVLSEVPFFDDLLRIPYKKEFNGIPDETMLKAAIRLYSQKRKDNEKQVFIKTDSWHIFFHDQIRKLYPNTPFILLYRSPDEVLRSLKRKPGMQSVPGLVEPEIFGFNKAGIGGMDLDTYAAAVLERFIGSFVEVAAADSNVLLVNYNEGILPVMQKITRFTGAVFTKSEWQNIESRVNYHGKYPDQYFAEPPVKEDIPVYLSAAMERYRQLERLRTSG